MRQASVFAFSINKDHGAKAEMKVNRARTRCYLPDQLQCELYLA